MAKSSIKEMKALSIAQPWAECIVSKGKNVENRTWDTKFRGYVAIHASKSKDLGRFEYCQEEYKYNLNTDNVDFGVIVGIAELVDVITKKDVTTETKKWFQGDYGFQLKNIIKLKKPVQVNGALSFWKLNGRPLSKVLAQLSPAQKRKISKNLLSKN